MPADVPLLVVRHGQSEWNAVRRWQGTADSPLTELGRRQASETAAVVARLGVRFAEVWASSLSRARQTAEILASALALPAPTIDRRLAEAHAGEWEGLTAELIEEGWPGWLDAHRRPSGFESFESVIGRVTEALDAIVDTADAADEGDADPILVVSHSGVIRSLMRHLGDADQRIPNLGGVWLRRSVIGNDRRWSLGDLFDPGGIVLSGVDAPGEEPGE